MVVNFIGKEGPHTFRNNKPYVVTDVVGQWYQIADDEGEASYHMRRAFKIIEGSEDEFPNRNKRPSDSEPFNIEDYLI